jgi:hypothetical protein
LQCTEFFSKPSKTCSLYSHRAKNSKIIPKEEAVRYWLFAISTLSMPLAAGFWLLAPLA